MEVVVNGITVANCPARQIPITLRPGYNTVLLTCDTQWLPDIDKIVLKKIT